MAKLSKKQVFIMRHAKSAWPVGVPDRRRPLSTRGFDDAALMAAWLQSRVPTTTELMYSPSKRTMQTAEILKNKLEFANENIEESLYHADLAALWYAISHSGDASLFIVGHNPGLEDLVYALLAEIDDEIPYQKLMPTSAVYCIELDADKKGRWERSGKQIFHQRPKRLRAAS